jgi:hypothetical protein
MKCKSTFALLDVMDGRDELLEVVGGRGTDYPVTDTKVPVVIRGYVTEAWGNDDGMSREFEVIVTGVELDEIQRWEDPVV